MTNGIVVLEHVAAAGWRATEEEPLGDWLLRAAEGFTGRANSALAAGDPPMSLQEAVGHVTRWYQARGLPPMIAVPYPLGRPDQSELDRMLASQGWALRADAATVMTATAGEVAARYSPREVTVEFADKPDAAWLARYHYRGSGTLPPVAQRLLSSAPWQAFASVRDQNARTIAVGRVAGAGNWAGLTAIEVDQAQRRRGLGAAVTAALTAHAAARGYDAIYLQVTDDNAAARALYRQLGFTDHHGYHYRVAPS